MDLFFLSADQKITKRYELDTAGKIIKHPYPFIYEVTSLADCPTDMQAMAASISQHSVLGHCLLKGKLTRQLVAESRAGSTDPDEKTDWVCLDLDGVTGFTDVDHFLETAGLKDVDYILQWSSSMKVESGNSSLRCHLFLKLDKPEHPQLLKYWLTHLNLSLPMLNAQLELTKTGNSLRWVLDVTTCQNDKLLYISPPTFGPGLVDPFPNNRISFEKRGKTSFSLPYPLPTREALRVLVDAKVNDLRERASLPKRKSSKYKFTGTTEFMTNPDTATVTQIKVERGFVYLNLNGGDSWAYYHPEDNNTFIYNFKGEPVYRTEDLLPEYWASMKAKTGTYAANSKGIIMLAFRDFATGNYYNGRYNTLTDQLELAQAKSETQLRHFMMQNGGALGEYIPDWTLVWDPHNPTKVDPIDYKLNTYQPSAYFQNPPGQVYTCPPTIKKVIDHVLGQDQASIDHFINWLAVIAQNLDRTGTAWVWQGTQGTGKGVLFHQILTPLFAEHNVVSKRMEELESEFTGYMENKFFVFVDEIETGKSLYHNKVAARLKNLIVEPTISVRNLYSAARMARNYANMIFASNKPAPVEIAPDDRRFNVGPYQNTPIQLTPAEIETQIPQELSDFYSYLMNYPADQDLARRPLVSAARSTLINISRTAIDSVADALLQGNMEFLWDYVRSAQSAQQINALQQMRYQPFRDLMVDLVKNQTNKLTRDDLFTIMDWCVGGMSNSPHKFASTLKHHRIHLKQIWKNNRNQRGIEVSWVIDPSWLSVAQNEIANNAV